MTHDFLERPGSSRPQRVGDQIQKELARLLQFEVKDPRLGMVTITGVEVAKDFAHADVWYSVLKGDQAKSQKALESASGFLRTQIGRAIKLRVTPQLRFRFDEAPSRGVEMSALIDKARNEDRSRAERAGDQPPGDERD
ncbi:MAG: 30S ribosome-binding factor RbfA [Pseudomonadota bacterium]